MVSRVATGTKTPGFNVKDGSNELPKSGLIARFNITLVAKLFKLPVEHCTGNGALLVFFKRVV